MALCFLFGQQLNKECYIWQVPENEHYGLRNALLQELGFGSGESILPNIHDEPIEFVDVSRMSLEVTSPIVVDFYLSLVILR
jgi:hypothetical protein